MGFLDDVMDGYEETKKSVGKSVKASSNAMKKKKTIHDAKHNEDVHYGFSLVNLEFNGKIVGVSREKEMFNSDPQFYMKLYEPEAREIKGLAFVGLVRAIPEQSKMSFGEKIALWGDNGAGRYMRPTLLRKFCQLQDYRHKMDVGTEFEGVSVFTIEHPEMKSSEYVQFGDLISLRSEAYENMYVSVDSSGYLKLVTVQPEGEKPFLKVLRSPNPPKNNPSCMPFQIPTPNTSADGNLEEPQWVKDMSNAFTMATM